MKDKKSDGAVVLASILRGYMFEKGLTEIRVSQDPIDSSFQDRVLTIEAYNESHEFCARLMTRDAFKSFLIAKKASRGDECGVWNCTPTDELN